MSYHSISQGIANYMCIVIKVFFELTKNYAINIYIYIYIYLP